MNLAYIALKNKQILVMVSLTCLSNIDPMATNNSFALKHDSYATLDQPNLNLSLT